MGCRRFAQGPDTELPFIEVDAKARTALRVHDRDEPFVPVGVNYFDPDIGWAPKVWSKFDEAVVRRELGMIRAAGFNTIRVFLSLEWFHREPGRVTSDGADRFARLIALCREAAFADPSGPITEGTRLAPRPRHVRRR